MNFESLGRLKKVNLRQIWSDEAADFTPWLARTENLSILADTLGLELEIEGLEKFVGSFRADILCKDLNSGSWVLIENQLERTDHTHLGQLLTYAVGLQAEIIIWIAASFSEEHRAVLNYFNKLANSSLRFFGLEVELWKIDSSVAAPIFKVVSKPNDWRESKSKATRLLGDESVTETKTLQLKYWRGLYNYLKQCNSKLRSHKPYPQYCISFGIGRSGFLLCATVNTRLNRIGVKLCINNQDTKQLFKLLYQQQKQIEKEIGLPLEWCELPEKKSSRITTFSEIANLADESDWARQQEWFRQVLEKFDNVFRERVKSLGKNHQIRRRRSRRISKQFGR